MSLLVLSGCGGDSGSVASSNPAVNAVANPVADDASQSDASLGEANPEPAQTNDDSVSVIIDTNFGEITLQLDSDKAPITVANFLTYVDSGHYEQTIFHRVIPGFMIQGGGFSVDYQRNETRLPILNEAANGLANNRYTIAMARTAVVHSATDQFYINVVDNPFLNYRAATSADWGYAVFGIVTSGFSVVERIASVGTGAAGPFAADVPMEPVIIFSIEREWTRGLYREISRQRGWGAYTGGRWLVSGHIT